MKTNFVKKKKILVQQSICWPLLPMADCNFYFNLHSEASCIFLKLFLYIFIILLFKGLQSLLNCHTVGQMLIAVAHCLMITLKVVMVEGQLWTNV